jgi:hypothetical protein
MSKNMIVLETLKSVSALFDKVAATYGRIDTQESDFKAVYQEVAAALALPDDVEKVPEVPKEPDYVAELKAQIAENNDALNQKIQEIEQKPVPEVVAPPPVPTLTEFNELKETVESSISKLNEVMEMMQGKAAI